MVAVQSLDPPTALGSRQFGGRVIVGSVSPETEDALWDRFLESTPQGHFQQSSLWACAKASEGWGRIRIVLRLDDQIVGGFQILARRTRFGNIGYIYKGPVMESNEPALQVFLIELITAAAKVNHLKALIIQPPDESKIGENVFASHRFSANHLFEVISATLVMDVSCSAEEMQRRMKRQTLSRVRLSECRNLTIREGGEEDIGTFFELMATACARQRTRPAPATESALLAIWRSFAPQGRIRLSLAHYGAEAVAGGLFLCFGKRVTFWKKGWSGKHAERNPNQLVMFEAMQWAHRQGYTIFDCAGLDRAIATRLLCGEPLSEAQRKSRDWFLLGFGGWPILLPPSSIFISNPLIRLAYGLAMACAPARTLARRLCRNLS